MKKEIESFINYFADKMINGKASFFIGSGISKSSGYYGWEDFLADKAEEIGLSIAKEKDLIMLAEYYIDNKARTKINESIKKCFADEIGQINNIHKMISSLPFNSIWTTNYDSLIERSLKIADRSYNVITTDESYRDINSDAEVMIYKIHGTYNSPKECVLARNDYENYCNNHQVVISQLTAEMCYKSFLFLGYGFRDADINHIFAKIRKIYDNQNPIQHFCIMKNVSKKYNGVEMSEEEYIYELKKQQLYISDMKKYGIEVLLVEEYSEIDSIIVQIRKKVYSKSVLISGSSKTYDEFTAKIIEQLTKKLIKNKYTIVTGYGENIGPMIVNGYFEGCYTKVNSPILKFSNTIKIIPFPFKVNTEAKEIVYDNLRNNMAGITTIQIIFCGKKDRKNGVYKEYEMCKEENHLIIPVAISGGAAELIWEEMNNEKENFNKDFFGLNNKSNYDNIVECIFNIIKKGSVYDG